LHEEILDQCVERVLLPLPNARCRKELILFYFDRHVRHVMERKTAFENWLKRKQPTISIADEVMSGDQVEEIVAATCGFTGDEIEDLMGIVAKGSANGKFDFGTAWGVIEEKIKQHRDGRAKIREHELNYWECDVPQQEVTFV
jgi:hypothetical protein